MGRAHGASRDILLLLPFHVKNMWSQCVSAPSVEVCISLRVYAASRTTPLRPPSPSHFTSSRSFSLHVVAGDYSPAKMQHLCIAARWHSVLRSYRTNLSGVRCMTNEGTFPSGRGRYFSRKYREFYSNITKINSSLSPAPPPPLCFGRRNGFHFFSTRENWFPISFNCKSIHCLFFSHRSYIRKLED